MVSRTNSGKNIQSVQRAIDILNCFTYADTALALGEISERLDLNKATVHGILNTLHNNDFVCQNSAGKYLLGHGFFSKAELASSTRLNLFIDSAKLYMQTLSNRFRANCTLFSIESNDYNVVHHTTPTNCMFVIQRASNESPIHATASGKLMLAYSSQAFLDKFLDHNKLEPITPYTFTSPGPLLDDLKEIRTGGYSYEREELFEGLSAIAVPIFIDSGKLFGTISLTGMSTSIARQQVQIISELKCTAQNIQQALKK